ncbi:MAG TPA: cytochrome C [Candidatus Desulfobacillus sp.]|nr:cytochrome C [Candidatus Desulfobacillus sp.]
MRKLLALMLLPVVLPAIAEEASYSKDIRPLWEDRCERCHGASAPAYEDFIKDRKAYELDDKGPRMDSYESLLFFVSGPQAGSLVRRLDDGARSPGGQPGNMYRHLGRGEQRKENLKLFTRWVGDEGWIVKNAGELSPDEIGRIRAPK